MSELLHNLVLFGRVLRGLGLAVDPGRLADLARALERVGLERRDVHAAARALLVRRQADLAAFDAAFDAFWRAPARGVTRLDLRALGERRRFRRPRFAASQAPDAGIAEDSPAASDEPPLLRAQLTWSAHEALRHKDFAELTADELTALEALMAERRWSLGQRATRRLQPGRGARLDLRRTLRDSLRHGGEVIVWRRRRPRRRPRPLVILADVSGSMERYTRALLLFMHGLSGGAGRRLEGFVFGTRLTRITRELRAGDANEALADVARAVADWSGGTRIGEALHAFNFTWGRRVLRGGAVVLLISDGWDRGDPALLAEEMGRLRRTSGRLVWLNPLLGSSEYEPLTRGMRAALPFVDDFMPAHNLKSMEDLARHVAMLGPGRRGARAGASFAPRPRQYFR